MALERSNPLPPGSYWVDIRPEDEAAFSRWLAENRGALVTRAVAKRNDGWSWIRFDVTAPAMVFWQGPGLPTISDPAVMRPEQVESAPTGCHWTLTSEGPEVVCDSGEGKTPVDPVDFGGAARSAVHTLAPWLLAGFLGWVFLTKRPPASSSAAVRTSP